MPAAVEGCAVFAVDCPVTSGVAETVAAISAAAEPVVAERPVAFHSVAVFAVGCPAMFHVAERVAADCPVRFGVAQTVAATSAAGSVDAERSVAFHSAEVSAVVCPATFHVAERVAAGCPIFVQRPYAALSTALFHHRSHHQSLTDCQHSEKIRSTAAAATNQLSW